MITRFKGAGVPVLNMLQEISELHIYQHERYIYDSI